MKQVFAWVRQRWLLVAFAAVVLGGGGTSLYFYRQYAVTSSQLSTLSAVTQEGAKALTARVSLLMLLPTDEEPTIATVMDKDKLKNQPFFANAQNGDKVLIYTKAKKAILYRPTQNRIIDVGPITIGQQDATPSAKAGEISITLYNGTANASLTASYESKILSKVQNALISARQNAKSAAYPKTIIIDIKGDKPAQVTQIARDLGISVASLPDGEATPSSDFLIILGADAK